MKKILFIIVLWALFGSCQMSELLETGDIDEIYAKIECDVVSKTSMDSDNNIRWSEGDQVMAFLQSSLGLKYQIISDDIGKTSGRFSRISSSQSDDLNAGVELDHNVIFYPYNDDISIEKSRGNYVLKVSLPIEQLYSESSFGNGTMPMLAVSNDKNIVFKNICGGIKLKLKGSQKITSIKLEGKNNEKLSGAATVTAYIDETRPTITMSSNASTSVILNCGNGIHLNENTATEFIITLPPVTFSKGFSVTVTDNENTSYTIETDKSNTILRSSLLVMPFVTLGASGPEIPEEDEEPDTISGHNTEPYFSETVELMGLIWRLAGSSEYCECQVGTISQSADSFFASMRNHKAVELAKQYRQQNICYDAVTGYANQLIFDEDGMIIFEPDYMEGSNPGFNRWNSQQKNDMLVAVNDFYKKSNFHEWFISTKSEQHQAIKSFKSVCNLDYTWFDTFYGKNDKVSSRIILSFMIGSNNNGISLKRQDGTLLLTPVLGGLGLNAEGVYFYGDMNLIVHEFSHPYCNPLIEANWSAISAKSEEVYKGVASIMQSQAYSNAKTMMCETLVRASAIRYMMSHNQKNYVGRRIAQEESNGFVMIRCFINALEKREQESDKYATLADFMPELIAAINGFDPDASYEQDETPEPDTLPQDYVDLGIEMNDGRKLYFATRNVGETSPGGIGSSVYYWGSLVNLGPGWVPPKSPTFSGWPEGHRLDAAHDIAAIKWGGDWHIPSPEEWNLLVEKCDYERKEAYESGYGVAGYFFYSKLDRNKSIFMPVAWWTDELEYWTSEIFGTRNKANYARKFNTYNGQPGCYGACAIEQKSVAIRPVIAAEGTFDANNHDYVDLDIMMQDGRKLYFATMNVGETSPAGYSTHTYCWGATTEGCFPWVPEGYYDDKWLDAAHDVATQTWGEKWHVPSPEEWGLLVEKCDYERKEAWESGYGVAGYFFYNKSDHLKYIFLPVEPMTNELMYWSSLMTGNDDAYVFTTEGGYVSYASYADVKRAEFAIRPVFAE